jgi:hypothetical protein
MLSRALSFIDTLHPVHEGRIYRWRDDSVRVCDRLRLWRR